MSKATRAKAKVTELKPPFDAPLNGAELVTASMNQLVSGGVPLSNKKLKTLKSHAMAENAHMFRSDLESQGHEQMNDMMLGITVSREQTNQKDPGPKFRHGESVVQWWANWMATATTVPVTYSAGNRPAWFSAEILGYVGQKSVMYAGFMNPLQHCYHVY